LYRNPVVRRMWHNQYPERIPKMLLQPTNLEAVKKVVDPLTHKTIEREVLGQINRMPLNRARETLKQLNPHLSEEARKMGDRIIASKTPRSKAPPKMRLEKTSDWVTREVSRPGHVSKKLMDYWKTKHGLKEIISSLKGNPNKDAIIKYLQEQSLHDFSRSVLTDGKFDVKKARQLLKNESLLEDIRDLGGPGAVEFTKNLDRYIKQLDSQVDFGMKGVKTGRIPVLSTAA